MKTERFPEGIEVTLDEGLESGSRHSYETIARSKV